MNKSKKTSTESIKKEIKFNPVLTRIIDLECSENNIVVAFAYFLWFFGLPLLVMALAYPVILALGLLTQYIWTSAFNIYGVVIESIILLSALMYTITKWPYNPSFFYEPSRSKRGA